jgi:hypothetical protein
MRTLHLILPRRIPSRRCLVNTMTYPDSSQGLTRDRHSLFELFGPVEDELDLRSGLILQGSDRTHRLAIGSRIETPTG